MNRGKSKAVVLKVMEAEMVAFKDSYRVSVAVNKRREVFLDERMDEKGKSLSN